MHLCTMLYHVYNFIHGLKYIYIYSNYLPIDSKEYLYIICKTNIDTAEVIYTRVHNIESARPWRYLSLLWFFQQLIYRHIIHYTSKDHYTWKTTRVKRLLSNDFFILFWCNKICFAWIVLNIKSLFDYRIYIVI